MLRDGELKYDIMEKEAYALVPSSKYLRVYVLHSYMLAYVPSNVVKRILTQPYPQEKKEQNGFLCYWSMTLKSSPPSWLRDNDLKR